MASSSSSEFPIMASAFKPNLPGRTMLFPCASGVQVPHVGADDIKVKASRDIAPAMMLPMTIVPQDSSPADNRYVKMVATGISFAEDVVEDRCLHMMPFSEKYFERVFNPQGLVRVPKKTTQIVGRHNKRGTDVRHMPCYLKKIIKPQPLTPLRRQVKEKAQELHKQALLQAKMEEIKKARKALGLASGSSQSSFFLTETDSTVPEKLAIVHETPEVSRKIPLNIKRDQQASLKPFIPEANKSSISGTSTKFEDGFPVKSKESVQTTGESASTKEEHGIALAKRGDWDDHLVSRLSQLTANWVVHERTPADKQKDKLSDLLQTWYGAPTHTDLVREENSDGEEDENKKAKTPKKKWKKKEASLLARVYNIKAPPGVALDPYSDDNEAPFYRQPAGIRKKKRSEEKEEAGAINATAHNIESREMVETPPPQLQDFLSPRVGDKIYNTDNRYQQERLIGHQQLFNKEDPHHITLDTNNRYQKNVQEQMPPPPDVWYPEDHGLSTNGRVGKLSNMLEKGHKRWTGLPEPVDDTANLMKAVAPGYDPVSAQPVDPKQRRKVKQNGALVTIVNEWRSKWFVSGQFADSTPEDLIKDMADIQPHVRLKAIGTVAKATEYKPQQEEGVLLEVMDTDTTVELPEEIFVALECLLDDSHENVRKLAAITLYSLDRPTDKAKERLREMLSNQSGVDRWAAAQCLAHYGDCDSEVVAEIIRQILNCEGAIKYEQGIQLLARISNSSTLVHCMVAEQLNSSSWRHRVIACKILPTLSGSINRDITQKLSQLMWHDWHVEVRNAAAQCLGKTSHGRDVHNDIRERIVEGSEKTKLEAINKLGQLGIMTAKLLPAFLQCFSDPYVSIRCETCITCGNLQIKEEQVLDRLVHLATFDPIWKVKAHAIQALGKIGVVTEDIQECLLWAMRYEEKEGVRAEACHSLVALDIQDEDMLEALQDRMLVESSSLVREEMIEALSQFGLSTGEDMDMVAQIKSEVRKLCTRNIIASQIIVNETDEARREQLARMVYQTEEDIEALNQKKAVILMRIRSQARSEEGSRSSSAEPRTSTPVPVVKVDSEPSSPEAVSREATIFTPTADKELEAILSTQEDEGESRSGESRPETEGGKQSAEDNNYEETEDLIDDGKTTLPKVRVVTKDEGEDYDDKPGELSSKPSTAGGPKLPKVQLDIPQVPSLSQSRSGGLLTPGTNREGSRLSTSNFSGRRSILSRDSVKERQRLNVQVNAIYSGLDARYAGMIADLCRIDRGLDTKGSSADSSKDNSLNAVLSNTQIEAAQEQIDAILSLSDGNKNVDINDAHITNKVNPDNKINTKEGLYNDQNIDVIQSISTKEETNNDERKELKDEVEIYDPDMEWKSFADTLSKDGGNTSFGGSTSYPSFDEDPDDPQVARSYVSTAGLTAQASEYDNDSIASNEEIEEDDVEPDVLKIY